MSARVFRPAARLGAAAAILAALAGAGCGGEEAGTEDTGDVVTVYSSLPLQDEGRRDEAAAIRRGIAAALEERDGRVGDLTVEHRPLDGSPREEEGETPPEREAANARTASQDDAAVAYIGALSFAPAAVSIPILNEGGLVAVSPGATYGGLTQETAAAQPGEPQKYYPTGERNFARIVPVDANEARVLAGVLAESGCESAFVAVEEEVATGALARLLAAALAERDVPLAGQGALDAEGAGAEAVAEAAADAEAACAVVVTTPGPLAAQAYEALAEALPDASLFGSNGACHPFLDPREGLSEEVRDRLTCSSYVRELDSYPGGEELELEDPVALYGYEAMSLILDAIEEGGDDRLAVREALLSTDSRDSPLGDYRLDDQGDTSLDAYAVYRVRGRRFAQIGLSDPTG